MPRSPGRASSPPAPSATWPRKNSTATARQRRREYDGNSPRSSVVHYRFYAGRKKALASMAAPKIIDVAARLPRRPRVVGWREIAEIELIAVHCDGRERQPGDDDLALLRGHAEYHIAKNW